MANNPVFLSGQRVPAGKLNKFGTEGVAYTPTLEASTSNPTLGSSPVQDGFWFRNGELAHVFFNVQFGTSGAAAGTGNYFVTLPAAAPVLDLGIGRVAAGVCTIVDASPTAAYLAHPQWIPGDSTGRIRLGIVEGATDTSAASPMTWTNNDYVYGHLIYPADFT
jgi:hypothetical protein